MIQCLMAIPGMITASMILFGKREVFNTITLLNIFVSLISLMSFHVAVVYMDSDSGFNYGLISLAVNGFFINAIWGYAMEYAVDIAPDVPESMSGGAITGLINVFSFT